MPIEQAVELALVPNLKATYEDFAYGSVPLW